MLTKEELLQVEKEQKRRAKITHVIKYIGQKSNEEFSQFIACLKRSGNDHAANLLSAPLGK